MNFFKIFVYNFFFISSSNYKFSDAIFTKVINNMNNDRSTNNFNHRFGNLSVNSDSLVPLPPAKITFIIVYFSIYREILSHYTAA